MSHPLEPTWSPPPTTTTTTTTTTTWTEPTTTWTTTTPSTTWWEPTTISTTVRTQPPRPTTIPPARTTQPTVPPNPVTNPGSNPNTSLGPSSNGSRVVSPTPTSTDIPGGGGVPTSGVVGIAVASVVVVGFIATTVWMKRRHRQKRKRPFGGDDPFGSLPIQSNYIPPEDVGPEMQMMAHNQHHHQGYSSPEAQAQSPHYLNQEVYHGYDQGYGHDGGGYGHDGGGYGHDGGGYGHDGGGYGGDQGGYGDPYSHSGHDAWGDQGQATYHHGGADTGAGSGQATNYQGDLNTGGGGSSGGHGYGVDGGAGNQLGPGGGQGTDFGPDHIQDYGPTGYGEGSSGVDQHLLDSNDGGGYNDGWTSGVQSSGPSGGVSHTGALPTANHPYAIPPIVPQAMLKSKDNKRISTTDYSNSRPIVHPAYPAPPPRTPSPASPSQSYPSTVHASDEQQAFLADGYSPQSKKALLNRIESIGGSSTAGGGSSYDPYHSSPLSYSQPLTSTSTVGLTSTNSAPIPPIPLRTAKDYPVTTAGTNFGTTDSGLNVERRISRQPQDMGDGYSEPISSFPAKAAGSPPRIPKRPVSTTPMVGLSSLQPKVSGGGQKRDPQGSIPNNPQAIREDQLYYVE